MFLSFIKRRAFILISFLCFSLPSAASALTVGEQLSENIIRRYQPTINAVANNGWDHANSIILHGMEKIYIKNKNPEYLDYIRAYVDNYVAEDGSISGQRAQLDAMHPGVLCLFMYETTNDKKYLIAAKSMRDYLLGTEKQAPAIPKSSDGAYWHKNNEKYREVSSVDGTYMSYPFLLRYGLLVNDSHAIDTALSQTLLVSKLSLNDSNGLPYHAFDSSKTRSWANPTTGQSTQFWSRAVGWYSMTLVDMLEVLPKNNPRYEKLMSYYQGLVAGILTVQNAEDGLWYQVLDKVNEKDNYPEMAGSGMIVYSLAKGSRLGFLDEKAKKAASKAWRGMQKYIVPYQDGGLQVVSVAPGMGAQDNYAAYVAIRPTTIPSSHGKQHTHGYMSVLLASSEME